MRIATVATLVAAAVIAQVAVAAAQAPPASPPKLEPVVVEASPFPPDRTGTEEEAREAIDRVPGGAELVGKQTIDESRAANLQDVLQYVPGVLIRPRFGAADESQLSIRGSGLRNNFHLRGINVLIDGFPYGSADGFSDFESLELMDTKRLEVYKGANALRFGANALGGAVNLVSKTGYDEGLLGLRSEAGSFGFFKNHIATGQVYGPLDLYLAYTDTRLDGYRVHGEQTRNRASASFGYVLPGGTTLRLDWGFTHNEENLPGSLTRDQFEANPRQRNPATAFANEQRNYDYTRGGFTVRTSLGEGGVLEGKVQLNYQDLDHPLSFAVIDQTTYNWGTELRYLLANTLFGSASRFTAGMQYFGTRQNDNQFQNLGDAERGARMLDNVNNVYTLGWYAEEQIDLNPALTLVLGGRLQYTYDSVRSRHPAATQNTDFFGVSPKAGVIYRAAPTVQVYANASRSYEPPLLLELTAPGNVPGSLGDLDAQRAWQFEVGTRGNVGRRVSWDVSVYDIELWDEIKNVNVQPFPGAPFTIPRYENIPRSRHMGVEVGGEVLLVEDILRGWGLGQTADRLRLRTSYTWSRFTFVNDPTFNNNDIPGAPEHFIVSELRYDHGSGFWGAPSMENVPKAYFVNSANTNRTSAYMLGNLAMGYDYKPWNLSVFFLARNLTDKQYISSVFVDDANGNYFFPGDGRAFYGGVAVRWK